MLVILLLFLTGFHPQHIVYAQPSEKLVPPSPRAPSNNERTSSPFSEVIQFPLGWREQLGTMSSTPSPRNPVITQEEQKDNLFDFLSTTSNSDTTSPMVPSTEITSASTEGPRLSLQNVLNRHEDTDSDSDLSDNDGDTFDFIRPSASFPIDPILQRTYGYATVPEHSVVIRRQKPSNPKWMDPQPPTPASHPANVRGSQHSSDMNQPSSRSIQWAQPLNANEVRLSESFYKTRDGAKRFEPFESDRRTHKFPDEDEDYESYNVRYKKLTSRRIFRNKVSPWNAMSANTANKVRAARDANNFNSPRNFDDRKRSASALPPPPPPLPTNHDIAQPKSALKHKIRLDSIDIQDENFEKVYSILNDYPSYYREVLHMLLPFNIFTNVPMELATSLQTLEILDVDVSQLKDPNQDALSALIEFEKELLTRHPHLVALKTSTNTFINRGTTLMNAIHYAAETGTFETVKSWFSIRHLRALSQQLDDYGNGPLIYCLYFYRSPFYAGASPNVRSELVRDCAHWLIESGRTVINDPSSEDISLLDAAVHSMDIETAWYLHGYGLRSKKLQEEELVEYLNRVTEMLTHDQSTHDQI